MFYSVSNAFERKRTELNRIVNKNNTLTSRETLHHSKQLDHIVNLYQNQGLSEMKISEYFDGSKLTIEIKGQLDLVTSENLAFYVEMNKAKWNRIHELYINLVDLNFFDTSGIRSLLMLILEAKKNNILVKTIKTSKTAFEVLKIMGIQKTLERINCGTIISI